MELKPGYKQTEVGVIPCEWTVKSLGEIGESLIGLTYSPQNVKSDGLLVLRSSNVSDGALRFDDNVFVNMDVPDRIVVRQGDILICVRNGSRDLIGKCAKIDKAAEGMTFGAFMAVFRTPFHGFVYHEFQSDVIKRQIHDCLGATINQITNKSLTSFRIPFPKDELERRAIATALDDVDALLAALTRLIAKKRDLKQAAMQQLLTGRQRLPGFSGEWEVRRLEQLGRCLRGVSYHGDADLSPYDTARTIRLLRSNNVQSDLVVCSDVQFVNHERVSDQQVMRRDDILICMANGSKDLVGKAGLFNAQDGCRYTFGTFMGCFRTDTGLASAPFVFRLFQTPRYRHYIANLLAGSSINNLKPADIESLEFDMPELDEQAAIASVLSDMDAEITALEAQLAKTRALKQGLMQELLTGRTRLV